MPNPQPSAPSIYEPEFAVQAYAVDTAQSSSNRGGYSTHKVRDSVIGGAAVAGGVVGLLIAGHVFALVGAVGACVLATQNNMAGEIARASGNVVVAAGDRAKKIDKEHHIVDKIQRTAKNALQSAKEFDEKHHVGEKISNGLKGLADEIRPKKK
uniref:Glycine zipper domain-containing protein n=1 Tax=Chaetoceros debilis TaxID=122233 RepID=A0A7S3PY20_9STRA